VLNVLVAVVGSIGRAESDVNYVKPGEPYREVMHCKKSN
jgi:hypothetical protein